MATKVIAAEPVSAYDAKTHLSRLLERTERGERFVITRHGRPVAQLVPIENRDDGSIRQVVERIAGIRARLERKGVRLGTVLAPGESARQVSHAGHRY